MLPSADTTISSDPTPAAGPAADRLLKVILITVPGSAKSLLTAVSARTLEACTTTLIPQASEAPAVADC